MEKFFNPSGPGQFDRDYLKSLEACLAKYDDTTMLASQDGAWKGMGDYFLSNGTAKDYMGLPDTWGGCIEDLPNTRCPVGNYKEWLANKDGEPFGDQKMTIFEPCNYSSNIAYYHAATRICDYPDFSIDESNQKALKQSFATLAMGSAMWHGSHTYVGYSFDNNMIAVISYIAHQASVSSLGESSILSELSETPRAKQGKDVAQDLVDMFQTSDVADWAQILDTSDIPHDYFITFAAFFSTVTSLVLKYDYTVALISVLVKVIIPKEDANFIIFKYLPRLGVAVKDIELTTA